MCITDSLCCAAETNMKCEINYTPVKIKRLRSCREGSTDSVRGYSEEWRGALGSQLWAWGRFPGHGTLLPEDCIS